MKLHYISARRDFSTRIFIPMQEWNALKYSDIPQSFIIPDWQKDIVLKRIEAYEHGLEDALDFEEAMKEIEKDI